MIFDDIFDVIANIIQESFIHDVHIVQQQQQQQSCCTNVLSIEIVRIAGIRILKKKSMYRGLTTVFPFKKDGIL